MSALVEAFISRFGKDNIQVIEPKNNEDYPLAIISLNKRSPIKVLTTLGLSDYDQPVPEKFNSCKYVELYFCLPSYWDLDEGNAAMIWVVEWLQKLAKHVVEKNTWFGEGHTIPNGNPAASFSATMQQKYMFLTKPIFLKEELTGFEIENKVIQFLGVLPIFEDEMDYKQGKGTYKLQKKFNDKGITELLDDYRMTCLKNKWRIFR
jgi:hypothetical protein